MTGAFSGLTTDRTATVFTAGDAGALLAFHPENEAYARLDEGTLQIAIDGSFGPETGVAAEGVNTNVLTQIKDVFRITNQGSLAIEVWITTSGRNSGTVIFYDGPPTDKSRTALDQPSNAYILIPGEDVVVSMDIDTRGWNLGPSEELVEYITVHAHPTDSD